jgi:hypothetical protein
MGCFGRDRVIFWGGWSAWVASLNPPYVGLGNFKLQISKNELN